MGPEDQFDDDTPKFNKTAVGAAHVMKSTLKWGAIGAIAASALVLGLGAFGLMSNPVGWAVGGGALLTGKFGALMGWALTTGLTWGGILGAVGGGLFGLSNMDEAIAAHGENLQAQKDNYRARRESNALLAHQRDLQAIEMQRQAQAMGVNPNIGYGMDPGNAPGNPMFPGGMQRL